MRVLRQGQQLFEGDSVSSFFSVIHFVSRIVSLGVSEDLGEVEARRVRTVNVIAVMAAVATVLTTTFYIVSVKPDSVLLIIALSALYSFGYAAAVAVNASGHVEAAVWLAITTGIVQNVITTFIVGFTQGPAPFFLIIALGAVLITRIEDRATRWFFLAVSIVGYVVLAIIDPEGTSNADASAERFSPIRQFVLMILFAAGIARYQRLLAHRAEEALGEANERSERLLLNVLPEEIADRLKAGEAVIAARAEAVTILFGDLVGSTPLSERLTPDQMVEVLNEIFTPFDDLADDLGLEKIKTIGDAYMVVGGLPTARPDHVEAIAEMALAMRVELSRHTVEGFGTLQMRYGIHTGSVVAGVIGKRKFSYDLWGDTVNTAARMESQGVSGEIQVTEEVYTRLKDRYRFDIRGPVEIKGKGVIETYFLKARNDPPQEEVKATVGEAT